MVQKQKHKASDKELREKIKQRLKETNRKNKKRKEKAIKAAEPKVKIMNAVLCQGSLCTTND